MAREDENKCCRSPQQEFALLSESGTPLENDSRITITLPEGIISREGLSEISDCLRRQGRSDLSYLSWELGDQWQTEEGNFAKRLSRRAYATGQAKPSPEVLAQVGSLARYHSTPVDVTLSVTRRLNLGAADFAHPGSCWWDSYGSSRCALKTNGGFGLRAFGHNDGVSGRAWVLPLRQNRLGNLTPTFNTLTPDAFVTFNGYGDLHDYAAPRVMARMTGWTYRKINFECRPMYVNANGYLIAPGDFPGELYLSLRAHADLFATEQARETGQKTTQSLP